jgi:hypothetical protein
LYLSLNREVSFTPLHVGWHPVIRILPIGITRERRMKPPSSNLHRGAYALSGPMERYLPMLALTRAL